MIYAIPYLLLFFFYLYWYQINQRKYLYLLQIKKNEYLFRQDFVVILIYLIFYGLRGFIFTDCFQYYDLFTNLDSFVHENSYVNFRYEPGYVLCNQIINLISGNFFVFQFIWTLIDVILIVLVLKRESRQYFLFSFALLIPFFDGVQMNLFRNVKGILLAFYAFKYIQQRSFLKYFICIIIGSSIHVSTIIFLPLYFIAGRNIKLTQMILCLASLFLYFTKLTFLNNLFLLVGLYTGGGKIDSVMNGYIESDVSGGFTLGFIFRLLMMIVIIYKYDHLHTKSPIMLNVALFYLVSSTAFNSILVMRDRFSQLFSFGMACLIPYLFNCIDNRMCRKVFSNVCILFLIGQVYIQHNNSAAIYENVITGISDRYKAEERIIEAAEKSEADR